LVLLDLAGHRLGHARSKVLITPGPSRAAEDREFTRQSTLPEELEQCWDQFAMGEVTARAEDHQALG
jgi:hypothetical protein